MQAKDKLKATGRVIKKLYGPDGKLKKVQVDENLIVTVGKNFIANWLAQASQATYFMQHVGLGTGTTAADAADIDLGTPLATRIAGTITDSLNVWQNVASFGPGVNTGSVTEAALFSANTGGTMFARQVFGVITKDPGDTLQVTWQVTFS